MPTYTEKERDTCIMVHLLRMSLVDGHRSEEEKALIAEHQMRLGLTADEMEHCTDLALGDVNPDLPEEMAAREEIFAETVRLAACDGLEEDETDYLRNLTAVFGIDESRLESMLKDSAS